MNNMNPTVKVKKSDVAAILARSFPGYRGRKFKVVVSEVVRFWMTNWTEGSRNEYKLVPLSEAATRELEVGAPWDNNVEGTTANITPGFVVVEHTYFQGHDLGITIHANPADAPKWLALEAR